jgi:rhodanese-related sulfurtransferase
MSATTKLLIESAWSRRAAILIRDFCVIAAMGVSAAGIGLAINRCRSNPLPMVYEPKTVRIRNATARLTEARQPQTAISTPPTAPEVAEIELPALREALEHKAAGVILDARPAVFYRNGHIPGAISLSREAFEVDYTSQRKRLEADKSQLIIVYCSDLGCEDSQLVADGLVKMAYTRVFVFRGGWEDWTDAHLPEEKAP